MLFSAIVHDYDHSGTTNNFHIQSGSNMAILYNDRAVLENHHVAEFFKYVTEREREGERERERENEWERE